MPTFRFKCNECKEEFEISASVSSFFSMDIFCPSCKTTDVKKISQKDKIVQKGKGVYMRESDNGDTT